MNIIHCIVNFMRDYPEFIIVGSITLIQITPIKIDPWTALLKWLGKNLNQNVQGQLDCLTSDMVSMRTEFDNKLIGDMRWNILDFSNSCKNGRLHTKEEWHHVISQLAKYDSYVEEKGVVNGVMEEETRYLKELYQERSQENDFL